MVEPLALVGDWSLIAVSGKRMSLGSVKTNGLEMKGTLHSVYGFSFNYGVIVTKGNPLAVGFKGGFHKNGKWEFGDFGEQIQLEDMIPQEFHVFSKEPAVIDAFAVTTAKVLNKNASYRASYSNLKVYFASEEAAQLYIDSILQ